MVALDVNGVVARRLTDAVICSTPVAVKTWNIPAAGAFWTPIAVEVGWMPSAVVLSTTVAVTVELCALEELVPVDTAVLFAWKPLEAESAVVCAGVVDETELLETGVSLLSEIAVG